MSNSFFRVLALAVAIGLGGLVPAAAPALADDVEASSGSSDDSSLAGENDDSGSTSSDSGSCYGDGEVTRC